MANPRTFVIVGASLAGARAAAALRDEGFDGRVVLLGEEAEKPYSRPSLSKAYLAGKKDRPSPVLDDDFYETHDIELRTSTLVTALDRGASEVELEDGERIGYDRLLLTTGAMPRALPVPGAELENVLLLRRVGDSDAIRERIEGGARFVVIGGGWIGAEVAATARSGGCEVAMVFPEEVPLERVLGTEFGGVFARLHEANGVELHTGAGIAALEGSGSVERVRLADGRSLDADVVIVGIGVAPRVELAEQAGLALSNGIDVDSRFRTSDENIWAAGDVAAVEHAFFGERIRVEHWAVANDHGPFAAKSMLGSDDAVRHAPVLLLRPVRRVARVLGLRARVGRGRHAWRRAELRRLLAEGRPRPGRGGLQRTGRRRGDRGTDPLAPAGRPESTCRPGHAARCRSGGHARGESRRGRRDRAGRRLARDRPGRGGQASTSCQRSARTSAASSTGRPATSSGSATATALPTRSTARSSTGRPKSRFPSARSSPQGRAGSARRAGACT